MSTRPVLDPPAANLPDREELVRIADQLPDEDDEPVETPWHRAAINFLIDIITYHWRARDDFYVGGDMFIYYTLQNPQKDNYRGPDFFYVADVDRHRKRNKWVVALEGGRYPNVIIELLSPSTAKVDRTIKKALYEGTFATPEYFLYDPDSEQLEGWRLGKERRYRPIKADKRGWMWCEQFQLWVGTWNGEFQGTAAVWLRFFDSNGRMIPHPIEAAIELALEQETRALKEQKNAEKQRKNAEQERKNAEQERKNAEQERKNAEQERKNAEQERKNAEQERTRADAEKTRADSAIAELQKLKSLLSEKGPSRDKPK